MVDQYGGLFVIGIEGGGGMIEIVEWFGLVVILVIVVLVVGQYDVLVGCIGFCYLVLDLIGMVIFFYLFLKWVWC